MESLALSTHLGYRQELVEGLWDLFHQVQQLQISIPRAQRGDDPRVKDQTEQQGSTGSRRYPHHLRTSYNYSQVKNRRNAKQLLQTSHLSAKHAGKYGLNIRVTLSK